MSADKSRRAGPGTRGEGDYYRIIVRPKSSFEEFRYHDVGSEGHTVRLTGKRPSGSWDTHAWLISKKDAYVDRSGYLRSDRKKTADIISQLGTVPRRSKEDIFNAKPRPNVPEADKPTAAQKAARKKNIKKAQQAR